MAEPKQPQPLPPAPTETRLYNRALYYLSRYAASEGRLVEVLHRRARREAEAHGIEAGEIEARIARVVERLRAAGYIDDQAYAAARARSQAGRGRSLHRLRADLAQRRVPREVADAAVAQLREEMAEPDLVAAVNLARRRRLGPWREPAGSRREHRLRDLAVLARAGFGGDVAREVIDAESTEALEERLAELRAQL